MNDFCFETWMALAALDPAAFELRRKEALRAVAAQAPASHQASLHALVEALCTPSKGTPLEKAVSAQNMMMESAQALQQELHHLIAAAAGAQGPQGQRVSALARFTTLRVVPRQQ